MDFQQFIEEVKKEVKNLLGCEYSVTVNCVMKINRELQGLNIMHGSSGYSPSVYLEDFYEDYKNGMNISEIAVTIVEISKQKNHNISSLIGNISDFQWVKPRLRVKIINYHRNERLLQSVPHERFLDLAIIPYILLSRDKGIMSTRVVYPLLAQWGITSDILIEQAKENTLHMLPTVIEEMTDFILRTMMKDMDVLDLEAKDIGTEDLLKCVLNNDFHESEMYIITNESNTDGAFAAFQTGNLTELATKVGSDKLYILPSSIHEAIVVPYSGIESFRLREMVGEINRTQVPEEDFLSDSIYIYNRTSNQICIAD